MSKSHAEPVSLEPIIINLEGIIDQLCDAEKEERTTLEAAVQAREAEAGTVADGETQEEAAAHQRLLDIRRNIEGLEGVCKILKALCLSLDEKKTLFSQIYR